MDPESRSSSEFLAAGTMHLQEGPGLPVDMNYPCAVSITPSSFLTIHGRDIREFDAAVAKRTRREGWEDARKWPLLKTSRTYWPGCAKKIGGKVIIAGGSGPRGALSSTEVLDLVSRRIRSGGEMARRRMWFHAGTIDNGGNEKVFALGGYEERALESVEEWNKESFTWKAADNLVERKESFAVLQVPRQLVFPP